MKKAQNMDYEKAYKESFKAAKGLHEAGNALTKKQMEIVFPQLAESKDEKIRKFLIDYFTSYKIGNVATKLNGYRIDDILAYLEKQKEQKSVQSDVEREYVRTLKSLISDFLRGKEEVDREYYQQIFDWLDGRNIERKPAEWSEDWREEDIQTRFAFYTYKDEDGVLYLSNVFVEEASRNHGFGTKILIAAEKVAETIGATTISLKVKQDSPANAWYRKNGYGYVAFEDGYDWLEKNLEYMKPNKQEWSEEDTKMLNRIINDYENGDKYWFKAQCSTPFRPKIAWLKSLRNRVGKEFLQPHWKPSEEQMKALLKVVDKARELHYTSIDGYDGYNELRSLYEQVKKLM